MNQTQVIVPVADMRLAADHRSERVSQALYGHLVTVIAASGDFARCDSADGYSGWIGRSYLSTPNSAPGNLAVVTSLLAVFAGENTGSRLTLPYGAHINSGGGDLFYACDRSEYSLVFGRVNMNEPVSLAHAIDEALACVSVPYLWGGASTFGFDCSGFTQAIFRRAGILLPRDSKDQATVGREVAVTESVAGDLIFFPGHVAIHLGQKKILHASRLRGMVAVESLDAGHPNYRADLDGKITTIRRVL